MSDTIYLTTKMFIPARLIDEDEVAKLFTHHQFEERQCKRCKLAPNRPVQQCWTCPGFKGTTKLYAKQGTANGVFVGVPLAQWKRVRKLLGLMDVPVKDLRPRLDFPQDLHWTGKLYDGSNGKPNQVAVVDQFWANVFDKGGEAGLIQCPPRFGKSPTVVNILCELGFRAIIFAAELGWLEQFVDTFIDFTNVSDLKNAVTLVSTKPSSKVYKTKPGVCVVNSVEKIPPETCVLLVAYQAFIHDPDRVAGLLHGKFTSIAVDECVSKDTLVHTDKGLLPAYEVHYEVNAGKTLLVLSSNHKGVKDFQPIKKAWKVKHSKKVIITLDNEEQIECSMHTKIWSKTRKEYVYAKDLAEGEDL